MSERRGPGDTRAKIRSVALELFSAQGYEQTSLREIADRLGITKAALYYHFRGKEDIVVSLFDDMLAALDELIAWATPQPPTLATRREILNRYAELLSGPGHDLMRFMQENQPAFRELSPGATMKNRFRVLATLLTDPGASLADQLRSRMALFAFNMSEFLMEDLELTKEQRQATAYEVALGFLSSSAP
jgi:AcrR family transcriptional regulator